MLGFAPRGRGDRSGHALWVDGTGRTCRPMFRERDVAFPYLYALGDELASQGVCSRSELICWVKAA